MEYEVALFFNGLLDYFHEEILEAVEDYFKSKMNSLEAPLILKFPINYNEWSKFKELKHILDSIIDEPLQSEKDIRVATWLNIPSIMGKKYHQIGLQLQQIHCIIRFSNLPLNAEYEFIPFRHPVRLSLSAMKCVLHKFSDSYAYVRQSVWYCPKQCCDNQNHIVHGENVYHKYGIGQCSKCNENLIEDEHRRSTYNCRYIRVFNAKSIETPIQYGKIHRSIKVKLSDDLCDVEMVLGQIYMLIGTYDILTQTYMAWNFHRFDD